MGKNSEGTLISMIIGGGPLGVTARKKEVQGRELNRVRRGGWQEEPTPRSEKDYSLRKRKGDRPRPPAIKKYGFGKKKLTNGDHTATYSRVGKGFSG